MIVERLEIVNFGALSNLTVEFDPELTVRSGANETGKTTLLEFLRRLLYGFPDGRSKLNPYPSGVPGGVYGGRLFGRLADGRSIRVERLGGGRRGTLSVAVGGTEVPDPEAFLGDLLGVGENFYRGVYAITLAELQEAADLGGDEIGRQLYGAETELGGNRLSLLKRDLADAAAALYRPRGSNQRLGQLRDELADWNSRLAECAETAGEFAAAEQKLTDLQTELTVLSAAEKAAGKAESAKVALQTAVNRCAALPSGTVPGADAALLAEAAELNGLAEAAEPYKVERARLAELSRLIEEVETRRQMQEETRIREERRLKWILAGGIVLFAVLGFYQSRLWFGCPVFAAALALRFFRRPAAEPDPAAAYRCEAAAADRTVRDYEARLERRFPDMDDRPGALAARLAAVAAARRRAEESERMRRARTDAERELDVLRAAANEAEKRFAAAVAARKELAICTADSLAAQIARLRGEIGGELRHLELLRAADSRNSMRRRVEELRCEAKEAAREYLIHQTALDLLAAAVARYEKEHQSEVVAAAGGFFRDFTLGSFAGIRQSLETHELFALRPSGKELRIAELSSGSREQLLLAMRLGLIAYAERRSEPLPVVLDDVLVNFDSERRAAAMTVLREFARTHQTILFLHS